MGFSSKLEPRRVIMTQFTRRDVSLCVPGEGDSHTLLFEARHNWTGLLVEPMVNGLLFKHRKVTADANIFSTSQIFSPGARGADGRTTRTWSPCRAWCWPPGTLTPQYRQVESMPGLVPEDGHLGAGAVPAPVHAAGRPGQPHRPLVHTRHRGGRVPGGDLH